MMWSDWGWSLGEGVNFYFSWVTKKWVFLALSGRESSLVQTFCQSCVHLDITHSSVHMTQRFVIQGHPTAKYSTDTCAYCTTTCWVVDEVVDSTKVKYSIVGCVDCTTMQLSLFSGRLCSTWKLYIGCYHSMTAPPSTSLCLNSVFPAGVIFAISAVPGLSRNMMKATVNYCKCRAA